MLSAKALDPRHSETGDRDLKKSPLDKESSDTSDVDLSFHLEEPETPTLRYNKSLHTPTKIYLALLTFLETSSTLPHLI